MRKKLINLTSAICQTNLVAMLLAIQTLKIPRCARSYWRKCRNYSKSCLQHNGHFEYKNIGWRN